MNCRIEDKHTPSLREEILGADTTGLTVAIRYKVKVRSPLVYTGLLNFPSLIFCWLFWCYVTPKNIRLRASLQKIASSCNQRTEESTYCSRRFLFWLLPTGSPTKNPRRFIQKGSSQEPIVPDMNGLADGNNNTLRYFFLVHEFSRSP